MLFIINTGSHVSWLSVKILFLNLLIFFRSIITLVHSLDHYLKVLVLSEDYTLYFVHVYAGL